MSTRTSCAATAVGIFAALYALCAAPAPVHEKSGNIGVLHGGIGLDDRAAMERAAPEYNLRLEFAQAGNGEYLANVRVVVSDMKGGKVLEALSSGPWLYAQLPAGEYSVAASTGDATLTHNVSIKAGGWRGWVFRFKSAAAK
jgi:hypothetical protein